MKRRSFCQAALAGLLGLLLPFASAKANSGLRRIWRKGERGGFVHWERVRMKALRVGDRIRIEHERPAWAKREWQVKSPPYCQDGTWGVDATTEEPFTEQEWTS